MVGKNNNYIRESKSNEHFQRFSLRKLSVGVVSVAVAAGFYLGSGTTAQAATAESDASAKTEQVVQQDATSAASDATSASNSSAASASSATPVSAESASSAAVSDSPASASAASDNQASAANASESSSQPASSSVASDAASAVSEKSQAASEANSQSAADKQTAQLLTLAANVNESQAANILSAQTVQKAANQQAPAGFTVTDPKYPAEMYKDPDASHYTYWWAQSSDGNYSLVLSTDRNGDGKVYVFLLGGSDKYLHQYTVDKNKSVEITADEGYFGTVYNDGQSGVFVSADGTWKSKFNVFDPKADEDDGDYGSISFMIPQVETQTTTYVTYFDSKGNKVDNPIEISDPVIQNPVIQKGLDGQHYTTQGGKVVLTGYYFAKKPSNAEGFMSPFGKQGATYTKDWHDGLKATFTETDTTTGLMYVVVEKYYNSWGWKTVKEFYLAPGQSEKVNYDVYKSVTIHSIYIPQTINIQYVYEKLGNLIIDSDSKAFPADDKTTTQYPNDESDSTKAGNVTIPKVPGFTPTINGKTVTNYTFNPADYVSDLSQNITVKYTADDQKATVTYVDDKTGKTLKVDNLNGATNAKSGYTTKSAIDTYTGLGYILVSDDTNGSEIVFDNDDAVDQAFTVHLSHGTITVTPENPGKPGEPINPGEGSANYPDGTDKAGLTDTVNRTITYVMSDGSKAPDAVKDSLSYTASKVIDKVTGEVLETKWSANQDFKDVDSPAVAGYTPDTKTVSNKDVAHDAADIAVTVKYTADAQKASVTYVDDKTGKTLKVDNLNGATNAKSGYTTKSAIDTYTGLGYILVSDDTNGSEIVFDNDDAVDQAFTVHLSHGTITVTPENPGKPGEPINPGEGSANYPDGTDKAGLTDTVNRTITYVMSDGSKAPDAVKDSLSYTASKVIDKVTGEVLETKWSANQDFKDVDSPAVAGYTPDKQVVSNKNIAHDAQDINVVVTYTADDQKATVTYIDDDNANKVLKTVPLNGKTNAKSGYTTAQDIQVYKDLGYVLVSDSTNGVEITFDNDDHKDQNFEVHFKHGTTHTSATDENADQKKVTETIHYVYENNWPAQPDYTAAVTFKRGYTTDNVTGKVVSYDPWTIDGKQADSKTFAAVTSPAVEGYTPNHKQINEFTVTPDSKDIVKTVVYVGDPQEAQAIFYDETTGKEISNTREIVNGKTDEAISFTKDPNEVVKELEKQGYVFDKDNANNNVFVAGTTYDKNSEVPQYFKYYFTHATTIVTPDNPKTPADVLPDNPGKNYPSGVAKDDLNKTVTRTINITTPDGKTQTITQKAEFTRSATVDEVTGEVTYGPWSKNVVLESVDVPNIPGYVPSASVPEITVTPNDQDMTINITYKKLDSGKATDQGANGGQAANGGSTTGQSAQNGQSGQTQNNAGAQQLPQTGNANNEKGALGLAGAMFAAGLGLGFGSKKKRHEN